MRLPLNKISPDRHLPQKNVQQPGGRIKVYQIRSYPVHPPPSTPSPSHSLVNSRRFSTYQMRQRRKISKYLTPSKKNSSHRWYLTQIQQSKIPSQIFRLKLLLKIAGTTMKNRLTLRSTQKKRNEQLLKLRNGMKLGFQN